MSLTPSRLFHSNHGVQSLTARFRTATRRRRHFPDQESSLKVIFLQVRERRQTGPPQPAVQRSEHSFRLEHDHG